MKHFDCVYVMFYSGIPMFYSVYTPHDYPLVKFRGEASTLFDSFELQKKPIVTWGMTRNVVTMSLFLCELENMDMVELRLAMRHPDDAYEFVKAKLGTIGENGDYYLRKQFHNETFKNNIRSR